MTVRTRSGPSSGGPGRLEIGDLMTLWAEQPSSAWNIALAGLLEPRPSIVPPDLEALCRMIAARSQAVPELRRRVDWTHLDQGRPLWMDDESFDVHRHVGVARLVDPSQREFLDWAATWAARPLDRDRPLWRIAFVAGLRSGKVGVVLAVHHAVADGVAGAALLSRLMDGGGASAPATAPDRRRGASVRAVVADLRATVRAVRVTAPALALPTPTGTGRHLVATSWSLAEVKNVGHRHAATLNDVVLAAVTAGMRRMLIEQDRSTHGRPLMASIPVAARPGARNAGGTLPMVVALPVTTGDAAAALHTIAARTRALKASRDRSYAGLSASPLMPVALARALTAWLRRHGSSRVNLFVTNVPGPAAPLRFGGARLQDVCPIAPVVAGVPLAVTVLSYAGVLVLTVNAAPAVAHLDEIVAGAREALEELGYDRAADDSGASAARKESS
jgi:diacylglycerol O-acyltransferase